MDDTRLAERLLSVVKVLDLGSADGRAGIQSLLAEIERVAPGSVEQMAARIELRKVGFVRSGTS